MTIDLKTLDPRGARALVAQARALRKQRALLAREDASICCGFILRDERTNRPIDQAPLHERWHRILDRERRVVFWSHVEAGKTNQIPIGRTCFELGKDPNLKVAIISRTAALADKIVTQVGRYVEKSKALRMVFPNLQPSDDASAPWRGNAITVKREGIGAKDPSVQGCGVGGSIIGSRIDLLILDDILDYYNTRTKAQRDEVAAWVYSSLMSRLTDEARVWVVGNAWDPDDVMHRMEKDGGFACFRFPVVDAHGGITWPGRFSQKRIDQFKRDLTPLEYARQLLCQARDDSEARFKQEWIDTCAQAGEGKHLVHHIEQADLDDGEGGDDLQGQLDELGLDTIEELKRANDVIWRLTGELPGQVLHGVDLAVTKSEAADLSCIFTLFVHRNGQRQVLNIQSGKWTAPDILARIEDTHQRFGGTFMVEANAAQRYIVQLLQHRNTVPVVPVITGRNKLHPEYGIESMGVELATGRWTIPSRSGKYEPEVGDWVSEMLFYDPRNHTGDRLMASWFAREGARRFADGLAGRRLSVGVRTF